MARHIQGRDGKLAGSIGDGKDRVPTAGIGRPASPREETTANQVEQAFQRFQSAQASPVHPGERLLAEYQQATAQERRSFMSQRTPDGQTYMQVLIDYAATPKGNKKVEAARAELDSAGFGARDDQAVNRLKAILASSKGKAVEKKEQARIEANERGREKRAALREQGLDPTADYRAMQPSQKVLSGAGKSLAEVHPDLAEEWHPGNPHPATVISANGGPIQALWLCKTCGHEWQTTVGNRLRHYKKEGRYERCAQCSNRLRFRASQEKLGSLIERFKANPEAFDQLPPAIRDQILMRMGFDDGAFAPVANALSRGDITLAEVLSTSDANDVLGRINFDETEADDADRELTEEELAAMADSSAFGDDRSVDQRVDTILATGDYASMLDPDADAAIVDQIITSGVRELWNEVHNNPEETGRILARVEEEAGSGRPQAVIAEEFARQVRTAQAIPLPEGYSSRRVNEMGEEYEVTPFLSQMHFASEVESRRRVANLSAPGAGKTISAIVASRHIGAQETVLFVPANVTRQWTREVKAAFPDTDVREGLPSAGEDLDATFTGRPRVWVVSYGALSADAEGAAAQLRPLAKRTDMVVLDEAHKVKSRSEVDTSKRRKVLERFADSAQRNNENLAVVAMTATPVVNDLEEAASFVRIVTGKKAVGFGTKPTKANALAAHRVTTGISVRLTPSYLANVERKERKVVLEDATMRAVASEYARLTGDGSKRVNDPSVIERALLPAKLPALVDQVKQNVGPTLVYSHYKEGMVDPVIKHLKDNGITAERLTGDESPKQREAVLKRFQRGETRVVVGTQAISTGVDGLQEVCHNLVNISPPWTAADEEQLVGRLNRTGQSNKVKVVNIVTEADLGDNFTWSYDRERHQRITYKRGLADAVTSGIIPQGHVASDQAVSKRAGEALLNFFRQAGRGINS